MDTHQINKTRHTFVVMTVETFGTEAQRLQTMQKIYDELELQGFKFEIRLSEVVNKPIPAVGPMVIW